LGIRLSFGLFFLAFQDVLFCRLFGVSTDCFRVSRELYGSFSPCSDVLSGPSIPWLVRCPSDGEVMSVWWSLVIPCSFC